MEENPFLCRKQTKDVILACLKISYGELHSVTYSQATQSWQTCTCELLTSRNLLFRPWAWFGEIRVHQTLILGRRQEGGEQGWAQGGNSREGWEPKLLAAKGAWKPVFLTLNSQAWSNCLYSLLSFHIQIELIPFDLLWPVTLGQCTAQGGKEPSQSMNSFIVASITLCLQCLGWNV